MPPSLTTPLRSSPVRPARFVPGGVVRGPITIHVDPPLEPPMAMLAEWALAERRRLRT